MNKKNKYNILPIEISKLIEKSGLYPEQCGHFYNQRVVKQDIIDKYGNLSDSGYCDLLKKYGGELEYDEVFGEKFVYEFETTWRDPSIWKIIPAYTIASVKMALQKYLFETCTQFDVKNRTYNGIYICFDKKGNQYTPVIEQILTTEWPTVYEAYVDLFKNIFTNYNFNELTKYE